MKIALFNLLVFLIVIPCSASAMDSEQKAIWALEEAYWGLLWAVRGIAT